MFILIIQTGPKSFLPEKLLSTRFAVPADTGKYILFASFESGRCTIGNLGTVALSCGNGVCQGYFAWRNVDPGTIVTCDVPVYAVFDQIVTKKEHVLYGYRDTVELSTIAAVTGGSLSSLRKLSNGEYRASFTANGYGMKSIAMYV